MADGGFDLPIYTVDAFTDEPFSGNPAAICLVPHGKMMSDETFQKIAAEMNLSETAYIEHLSENSNFATSNEFKLRWFTPTNEVPLCGHATLASAAVLFFCSNNSSGAITFRSKSGPLIARRDGESITLDFPINPVEPYDRTAALSIIKEICDPALVSDVQYSPGTKKLLLRLEDNFSRELFEGLCPDPRALQATDSTGKVKGVIVTVRGSSVFTDTSGQSFDFVSRYFAPWNGIPEDPVTGSAHTVLADFWRKQMDKSEFYARQCSKRGGDVKIKIMCDRVELTGKAKVVLRGTFNM
ncbi:phenazine biosynthesis-like domain-containing protein [Mercenaria mercenaria]|uniref:phenazine biosynthesis-like domain-containing protein n=1 Tax=Mercenaria mercenaria TaxID=6596 RepID=UPI00234F2EF9|nr:phenazine biosynthesis-like domain-containing protein [Mercenaria mercenaria]